MEIYGTLFIYFCIMIPNVGHHRDPHKKVVLLKKECTIAAAKEWVKDFLNANSFTMANERIEKCIEATWQANKERIDLT